MSAMIEASRSVMRPLIPRIHAFLQRSQDVDRRVFGRKDGAEAVIGPRFARTRWRLLRGDDEIENGASA